MTAPAVELPRATLVLADCDRALVELEPDGADARAVARPTCLTGCDGWRDGAAETIS
jgi:hypothetical protein